MGTIKSSRKETNQDIESEPVFHHFSQIWQFSELCQMQKIPITDNKAAPFQQN